jgi:type VI secretion system secreted protein Hcp
VLWWRWGMTSSPTAGGGAGAGAGKVSFRDLAIGKRIDAATAKLMLACASGQHIGSAELTARQRRERAVEYLKVTLQTVLVTAVAIGEPDAGGEVTETVTLNFRQVRVEYLGQTQTGAPAPAIAFGWDLARNAPA